MNVTASSATTHATSDTMLQSFFHGEHAMRPGPSGDVGTREPMDALFPSTSPESDDDITVERWGLCGDVMGVSVDTGAGDDDIKLRINADGSSDLWVNGEYKGHFTDEETSVLTIQTGEGGDHVTIEDNRAFQDDRLPTVYNNGSQGTDQVDVCYPGYAPATFPLAPGQRSN